MGTRSDYERSARLQSFFPNKSFAVIPHWIDAHCFLYKLDSQAWLVDARSGKKSYHSSNSSSLSSNLQLCPPENGQKSGHSSIETGFLLENHLDQPVRLLWLDWEGVQREYGIVRPFKSYNQHTYVDHAWLVTTLENRPLASFVATQMPSQLTINQSSLTSFQEHKRQEGCSHSTDMKFTSLVQKCNLHLREKGGKIFALSKDGIETDSYEDQVYWSPDRKKLVAFQTTKVSERKISIVESSPTDQLYPKIHTISYEKPGDLLPQRRLRLFDVTLRKQIRIPQQDQELFFSPWSISDIHWNPDSDRFTFLYNQRGHQLLRIIAINAKTGQAQVIVEERSSTFIDYNGKLFMHYLDQAGELIWMSERDGWNHLYLYDSRTGAIKNQITCGKWVVRGVDLVDEDKRQVWFRASGIYPEQDPYYIHYCRINLDGSKLVLLTAGDGTHSVVFSPERFYLIDTYSRVDFPPTVELRHAHDGALIMKLESFNISALERIGWKSPKRFVAKGRDHKTDIYGVIFQPTNFNPNKKYPVIENIYAGPQDSFVPKGFSVHHGSQKVAELGFIVVQIDGMGTSNRSKAFHNICAKNIGDAGLPDRILWMKAAALEHPYMDLDRIGIYGVSAGGQSALGALLMYPDFYKVAVSACGCHDNRMDKMWWNELWMGWPLGPHYHEQSNVTQAHRLQGKLLLIVCEMDTNVDPASTLQVVNALVKADKDFDLVIIPGSEHGMGGAYGERRMQDFFVRHLLGVEPRNDCKHI